ncbi:ABC transporter permease [Ktedonobacter racemifer]|uniref:ABC transporter permease n=1 Tax=Ktedonobacter racemifer DSM 44963 TaxID=485913 RepID=D6TC18_KTERA|nr:ABC transporter permease [Ktedonobacter racemifer]EFH88054.1 conserved hypothetical protein [Ktedonobacter racemifer DSM 44963]
MMRALRSELTKLRRWSVLAGGAAMIIVPAAYAAFSLIRVTSSAKTAQTLAILQTLSTAQGLTTMLAVSASFATTIAIILVAANVAAEWSQGTLRNLLVREPRRLRLLAGKMLALLLYAISCEALALLIGSAVALLVAQSHGLSITPWTSSEGMTAFFSFFGYSLFSIVGLSFLGMLTAVLTRSAAAAVGITLAYALVGEVLIGAAWPDGAQWLPVHLFGYLTNSVTVAGGTGASAPPMGYGSDVLVALLWMVGFLVISAVVVRRRDVLA